MQQASYLKGGPLLWILPPYRHVDKKSDDDDDDEISIELLPIRDRKINGRLGVSAVELLVAVAEPGGYLSIVG